jgi:hypothetical protein
MTFGRMNNMRRRTSRPDENHHRDTRRNKVDRSAMLGSSSRRKKFGILGFFGAMLEIFRRR